MKSSVTMVLWNDARRQSKTIRIIALGLRSSKDGEYKLVVSEVSHVPYTDGLINGTSIVLHHPKKTKDFPSDQTCLKLNPNFGLSGRVWENHKSGGKVIIKKYKLYCSSQTDHNLAS